MPLLWYKVVQISMELVDLAIVYNTGERVVIPDVSSFYWDDSVLHYVKDGNDITVPESDGVILAERFDLLELIVSELFT